MKFKVAFLLFSMFLFSSCKKEIPASIKLKVEFSDKSKKELPRVYFIDVYKNGKIFKEYKRFGKPRVEKEILIDSLSNGTYKFVYHNFLNQQMQKTIEINENKVYTISIHPDYSKYIDFIDESFVKNLKDKQKVVFNFESLGCFHSVEGELTITKKKNCYFAESHGFYKKLNKKDVEAIIKMESELNLLQQGGCTTLDHYIVKFENQKKEYDDVTCAWNGWVNLFKQIHLINSKE